MVKGEDWFRAEFTRFKSPSTLVKFQSLSGSATDRIWSRLAPVPSSGKPGLRLESKSQDRYSSRCSITMAGPSEQTATQPVADP